MMRVEELDRQLDARLGTAESKRQFSSLSAIFDPTPEHDHDGTKPEFGNPFAEAQERERVAHRDEMMGHNEARVSDAHGTRYRMAKKTAPPPPNLPVMKEDFGEWENKLLDRNGKEDDASPDDPFDKD